MFIVHTLTIIVAIAYFLLLTGFVIGWERIKIYKKRSVSPSAGFVSVIVAARNEENNIVGTLSSLAKQSIGKNAFEVIVVDDFSSDGTVLKITGFCKTQANFKYFAFSKHQGKKQALDYGIKKAKGELIITTDADCTHHEQWLETIAGYYSLSEAKMICAPVLIKPKNWFEKMQGLDFLSLMASGGAATGIGKPILNNGANLGFSKKTYLSIDNPNNESLSSGDDVFLLLKFKEKFPGRVRFLKSKKAIVYTEAQKTFAGFISQRKRWASKSTHYRDFDIVYTAITVLSVNSLLLLAMLLSMLFTDLIFIFLSLFVFKSILDFVFLYKTSSFFQQKNLLKYFLPVQLANIFLIPFLAFAGLFTETKWKEKTVKK